MRRNLVASALSLVVLVFASSESKSADNACEVAIASECAHDGARLDLERDAVCTFEKVKVRWRVELKRVARSYAAWGLAVVDKESGKMVQRIDLRRSATTREAAESMIEWETQRRKIEQEVQAFEELVPVVGCEVVSDWEEEEESCGNGNHWPKMTAIVASPGYGPGSHFTITFDRNTNQPAVYEDQQVRGIVSFSNSIGSKLSGEWIDPRTLKITVVDDTGRVDYHKGGVTASLVKRPRSEEERSYESLETAYTGDNNSTNCLVVEGLQSFRFTTSATIFLALYTAHADVPVATSPVLSVDDCNDDDESDRSSPILIDMSAHTLAFPSTGPPEPIWKLQDRVVLENSRTVLPRPSSSGQVASSFYEDMNSAGWSLSFWLYLIPKSKIFPCSSTLSNSFRALLYHGRGVGHESGARTPSLWLFPHSNHIALRVSSSETDDFGIDSAEELQQERWTHISVVFRNGSKETDGPYFLAQVFIDGQESITLEETKKVVLANQGDLHFAHDAWGPGPSGFAKEIKLYDLPLSRLEILEDIKRTRPGQSPQWSFDMSLGSTEKQLDKPCLENDPTMNGQLYETAMSLESPGERLRLLQAAADDGHPDSLYELAASRQHVFSESALLQLIAAGRTGHAPSLFRLALWNETAPFFASSVDESTITSSTDMMVKLEQAALRGSIEAKLVLAHELERAGKCTAAVFYFSQVAGEAAREHSATGQQPMVEMQILSDFVEEKGERGVDDEQIQYQILRADQGDVEAMMAMGGLYYWGAHGLPRDQERAFRYFERAAHAGHAGGKTACGNMLLKGEGVPAKNRTKAMELYEEAANQDNLEALNGLGFIYFFGSDGVDRNVSKALEYFERNLRDGDSLYNAAHIYFHEDDFRNIVRAKEYLVRAAEEFGSFSAMHLLGSLFHTTEPSEWGCEQAKKYYRSAALRGSWGKKLREGFDAFLDRDLEAAAFHYLEAAYMGYSRGAENAIWLLNEKLGRLSRAPFHKLFSRVEQPMAPLQRLAEGDICFQSGDLEGAIQSWVRASVDGDWSHQRVYRAQASYNLGIQALQESNWGKAERYFDRAASFLQGDESDAAMAANVALKMGRWRLKVSRYMHPYLADVFG